MICEVKLRVKTMWLGSVRSQDKIRRFSKDEKKNIKLDIPFWLWAIKSALPEDSEIATSTLRLPLAIRAPRLDLYRDKHDRLYEAIHLNTVLTFSMLFTPEPPPGIDEGKRPPTVEEFKNLLSIVGEKVGLSPYRSEEGWGRFTVESVT